MKKQKQETQQEASAKVKRNSKTWQQAPDNS